MVSNMVLTHGNQTPSQGLLGFHPRDFYDLDTETLDSVSSALLTSPAPFEAAVRLRYLASQNILQSVIEERIARAQNTRVIQGPMEELKAPMQVDINKLPGRKDQTGWKGPAELVKISDEG